MKRCYYEILEIERTVSAQEIKTAYRKKALQYHPDRNPSQEAEEKFKEASEAYEVLSDTEKRSIYDRFGHEGLDRGGLHHGYSDVGDIFNHFGDIFEDFFGMGGGGRRRRSDGARHGRDLRYDLQLNFFEAYEGVEKKIEIDRQESCPDCEGLGYPQGTKPEVCHHCNGTGQLLQSQGFFTLSSPCPTCRGEGRLIKHPCEECRGKGMVRSRKTLKVKIPAGIDHGMQLCLREEGEGGRQGGRPGDLYVVIHLEQDPRYHRQDQEVLVQEKIPMVLAALGGSWQVETPKGPETLTLPPGIQTGEVLRIPGLGMPSPQGKARGDFLVQIWVEIPKNLNQEQKDLLSSLGASMGLKNFVEKKKEESSFTKKSKSSKKSRRFW